LRGPGLLVGGCDLTRDSRYYREGIGTDLYWDGLPAATQLQDIYLANICAQAISPTARSVDTVSCDGLPLTPRNWGLLVQAGMNDIDLRCDSYLSWLYDKKSSKEPILKELASVGGASAAVLAATGAGATPIALTAIAFGLAANTFTNIDQRLVNAVDYSTVDSVVRDNRTLFRRNNLDLVIDNRPAAIYVLRNYLAICVPDSIEMSINNTVTVYHRGGPDALLAPPIGLTLAPATSSTSAAVRGTPVARNADIAPAAGPGRALTSSQPIARVVRAKPADVPGLSDIVDPSDPGLHSQLDLQNLQEAMCVPLTEQGKVGPYTKANIQIFEAAFFAAKSKRTGTVNRDKVQRIEESGLCPVDSTGNLKFKNYFEKVKYPDGPNSQLAFQDLAKLLTNADPAHPIANISKLEDVRDRIKAARHAKQAQPPSYPIDVSDQVTPDLLSALRTP
jgi:hypothetical protein